MKLLAIMVIAIVSMITSVEALVVNEYTERTCNINDCKDTIYSYQKYYRDAQGQLVPMNETFDTRNCRTGFTYCVDQNQFQFHVKQQLDNFKITRGEKEVTFKPNALITTTPLPFSTPAAQVNENVITYVDILPGILDMRYTYTWAGVKEEFIVKENIFRLLQENTDVVIDFSITTNLAVENQRQRLIFADQEGTQFTLDNLYAQDNNGRLVKLEYTYVPNSFRLKIPVNYLRNATYPVVIDPTVELFSSDVSHDGYISYNGDSGTFSRYQSGVGLPIKAGDDSFLIAGLSLYRGVIEWDATQIPQNTDLDDIDLSIFFTTTVDAQNQNISFRAMDGNWTTYANNNTGNQHYYIDMGNGTLLANMIVNTVGRVSINLSSFDGGQDLENKRANKTEAWWGIGIHTVPEDGTGITPQQIASAGDSNTSRRPRLIVTYRYANESEGEIAIEQGIRDAAPSAYIHQEQQIYVRHSTNTHQLGRFDRFASSGMTRWGFNYITEGEAYANLDSIDPRLYFIELTNMTSYDIRYLVNLIVSSG